MSYTEEWWEAYYAELEAELDSVRRAWQKQTAQWDLTRRDLLAKSHKWKVERDRYRQVLETLEGRVHICRDDRGYRAEECPGCDIREALQEEE